MVHISATNGDISIGKTGQGVPRVVATDWRDALFGLGFVHGRDRGAQIELMRILAQGRLCERVSDTDSTLALDRYFRRLALAHDAAAHYAGLDEPYRGYLAAYRDGVNRARERHYPWLYRLVTGAPEPFRDHDVLLLTKLTAYLGLAEGQRVVETFLQHGISRGVDAGLLQALCPALQADAATLLREGCTPPPLYPAPYSGLGAGGSGGSNAWVAGGAHTASGLPLLANDPHLEVNRLPAVVYEVQLNVGGERVTGATLPGLPAVISGRNRHLAWGVTYSCADTCDFFVEHLRDGAAMVDSMPRPLQIRSEPIRRKHHPDDPFEFAATPNGTLEHAPHDGAALSWRWTGSGDGGLRSVRAFIDLLGCRDAADAQQRMRHADLPTLHMVFADRAGNIAYQMTGAIPARHNGWSGLGPAAGYDSAHGWSGLRDPAGLPSLLNPPAGIITVTNDDRTFGAGQTLSTCWLAHYRGDRIAEILDAGSGYTPADFQSMQYDVHSGQARAFLPHYLAQLAPGPARRLLEQWDGRYTADAAAATLFETLHRNLVQQVFGAHFGDDWFRGVLADTGLYGTLCGYFDRLLLMPDSPWLPAARRSEALARAVAATLGDPTAQRPWGERNTMTLSNLFFGGRLPRWLGMDYGPYSLPGNHATISQGNVFQVGARTTSFAPCYRGVADLAGEDLWSNYPGGPTEARFSRAYRSGFDDWRKGGYTLASGD